MGTERQEGENGFANFAKLAAKFSGAILCMTLASTAFTVGVTLMGVGLGLKFYEGNRMNDLTVAGIALAGIAIILSILSIALIARSMIKSFKAVANFFDEGQNDNSFVSENFSYSDVSSSRAVIPRS